MYNVLVYKDDNTRLKLLKKINVPGPFLELQFSFDADTLSDCDFEPHIVQELGERIVNFIVESEKDPKKSEMKTLLSYSTLSDEEITEGYSTRNLDIIRDTVVFGEVITHGM